MIHWIDRRIRGSIYLGFLDRLLNDAYRGSANWRFIRCLKIRLRYAPAPAWIAELYQLLCLLLAGITIVFLPSVFASSNKIVFSVAFILAFFALYRLSEILFFTLHWVFIAKAKLKSYRRSLAAFIMNLVEVAALYTILRMFAAPYTDVYASQWVLLYQNLVSVFTVSLAENIGNSITAVLLAHAQVVQAWILLLIVLAVVVGGITRGELDEGLKGS